MPIGSQTLDEFTSALREKTPTPGGGAAAAVVGRLGAALFGMVLRYSQARKGVEEDTAQVLGTVDASVQDLLDRLRVLADQDVEAYEALRAASRLPRDDVASEQRRDAARRAAAVQASEVPLRTLRLCVNGLEMMAALGGQLAPMLEADTRSAAGMLVAGAESAACNIRTNLPALAEEKRVLFQGHLDELLPRVGELRARIESAI